MAEGGQIVDHRDGRDVVLRLRGVRTQFGDHVIHDKLDFDQFRGEIVGLVGGSGTGKSVLLKCILGLMTPDSGTVLIDGEAITGSDRATRERLRAKIGMLFQGAALFDSLTVAENIGFPLARERRHTPAEIRRKVAEALEMVELAGTEDKKPSELSGGMRKRVGLARAIIYQPEIVLYDEPTTGLDPVVSDSIDKLILRVRDRLKVTTVVVTHDMRSARTVGNRILMLHDRRIYVAGTPEEMFNSTDPVVHRFVNGISVPKEHYF